MQQQLTLLELNQIIHNVLDENISQTYWVRCEISEIRFNSNGHCYLELAEKDEQSDNIIAKSRATIWSYVLRMIKPYFETTTGQQLSIS